jgi:hypothetical protein
MTAAQLEEIHVDDYGTILRMTIGEYDDDGNFQAVDISSATVQKFRFEKPDGTTFEKVTTFTAGGADGKIQYTVEVDILNANGQWRIQAYIVMPTGGWSSEIKQFHVHANIVIVP